MGARGASAGGCHGDGAANQRAAPAGRVTTETRRPMGAQLGSHGDSAANGSARPHVGAVALETAQPMGGRGADLGRKRRKSGKNGENEAKNGANR